MLKELPVQILFKNYKQRVEKNTINLISYKHEKSILIFQITGEK